MADVKVSALTAHTAVAEEDYLYIVDDPGGVPTSKKVTVQELRKGMDTSVGVYNVVDYGATGDGSTDDTTAIQSAIDAAATAGGGIVFVPNGTYKITSALTIANTQNFLSIVGAGATYIKNFGLTTPHFLINSAGAGARRLLMRDLMLSVDTAGTTDQHGIKMLASSYDGAVFDRIRIGTAGGTGPGGHGFYFDDCITWRMQNCTIDNCTGDGIYLTGFQNACVVLNTTSRENGGNGFTYTSVDAAGGYHLQVIGGVYESNTGAAFQIDGGNLVTLIAPHVESNGAVSNFNGGRITTIGTNWGLDGGLEITDTINVTVDRCLFGDTEQLVIADNAGVTIRDCAVESLTGSIDDDGLSVIENLRSYAGNSDCAFSRLPHHRTALVPSATSAQRGWLFRNQTDDSQQDQIYFGLKSWLFPGSYKYVPLVPVQHGTSGYPITDSDYVLTPPDGTFGFNTADYQMYVRMGGAWRSLRVPNAEGIYMLSGWVADDAQTTELGALPANSYVKAVHLHVTEAFDSDGTDNISVGYDGDADAFATDTDVATTGVKTPTLGANNGYNATARTVKAYYTNGGSEPTTGKAIVILEYTLVDAQVA